MGQRSNFQLDNTWQFRVRDAFLKPYYKAHSLEGRFVFADKGSLAEHLQRVMAVDTIMQSSGGALLSIEEKIVRWPGYEYTAFTFEIESCTVPGRERKGWMHTAKCDVLLYCFMQEDECELIAYAIPFKRLQNWFLANYQQYRSTVTEQINHTECKIVPILDVLNNVHGVKKLRLQCPQEV